MVNCIYFANVEMERAEEQNTIFTSRQPVGLMQHMCFKVTPNENCIVQ